MLLAKRKGESLCLLYADVDDFNAFNEELGHQEGDHVLKEVAQTLKASYRETDIIARFGGDEFIIMPVGMLPDEATLIIDRFNRAFERVQSHSKKHPVTVSFGLAVNNVDESRTLDELIYEAGTSIGKPGPHKQDSRQTAA
jgi:diguanylate cyclase (GGDEF)-like protein